MSPTAADCFGVGLWRSGFSCGKTTKKMPTAAEMAPTTAPACFTYLIGLPSGFAAPASWLAARRDLVRCGCRFAIVPVTGAV